MEATSISQRRPVNRRLPLLVLLSPVLAWAQSQGTDYEWVNRDLIAKQIPREQYVAIGRGDMAECRISAERAAIQAAPIPDCSRVPVHEISRCTDAQYEARRLLDQTFRDLYSGCMARRGWVWTKVR